VFSNLKAIIEGSGYNGSLKAKNHSYREISTQNRKSVQKSKIDIPNSSPNLNKNDEDREPGEPSASKRMRGRSHRSSLKSEKMKPGKAKGDSSISSTEKQGTRNKVSLTNQSLRSFVQYKLSRYKDDDNRMNGIVNILADPGYLQFCYMLIKGKPGNMSKGITKETLDGIKYE